MNNNNITRAKMPSWFNRHWGLVIVLLIMVAIIAIIYYANNIIFQTELGVPVIENKPVAESDGLPKEFFSYTGKILALANDQVVIKAVIGENYLKEDKTVTAKIDETTEIVKLTVNQKPGGWQAGESGEIYKKSILALADLNVGDKITVIALTNVKNKTELTAAKIERME